MASGWLGWDWGTVPAWVGTVVTGGSALIAALAYRRSVLDKEREQASKVAAWTSVSYEPDEDKKRPQRRRRLYVRNSSDAPVYEVVVRLDGAEEEALAELQADGTATYDLPDGGPAAGKVREFSARLNFWIVEVEARKVYETVDQAVAPLEFRDAMGRWWARSSDGKLKPLRVRTVAGTNRRRRTLG